MAENQLGRTLLRIGGITVLRQETPDRSTHIRPHSLALCPVERRFLLDPVGKLPGDYLEGVVLDHLASRLIVREGVIECDLFFRQQQGFGSCKGAVVVDSGVHGNVITAITGFFPETTVSGVLLYSENPVYPSSEASLLRLGAPLSLARFERRRMLEDRIERLPHFERKVVGYEVRSGQIVPRRQASASSEWRKRALGFMTELRREWCSYVLSGGWKDELRAFRNLVEAVDASTGRTRRAVVPLRELESRRAESGPVGSDHRGEVAYALADLGREAAERLKDPLLTIELDPSSASQRVIAAAKELTAQLGEPRLVVACPTGPTARQETSLGGDLNPQQVVAAVWARLDKDVQETSTHLIKARLDAVLRLPHGAGFIKDLLDVAARRALDRPIRAEAVGAIWELLTGRR